MREAVGDHIFRARTASGASLAELSKLTGIPASTIWRIERGITDPKFSGHLLPLFQALGLGIQLSKINFNPRKAKP